MTATITTVQTSHASTDIGEIWKEAIHRYEKNTMAQIQILPFANSVDDILNAVKGKEAAFRIHRHDGSKFDKFRSLLAKIMNRVDVVSDIVAQPAVNAFPPSAVIFIALRYFVTTANSVSADYDKITEFFEDLDSYLSRLKLFEVDDVPPIPELKNALSEALTAVLDVFGVSTKYIKTKRIVKISRNLVSGEDKELTAAYARFHKAVEREEGIVRNATLVVVNKLQKESDQTGRALIEKTENIHNLLQSSESRREKQQFLDALSGVSFHEKQKDTFAKHSEGTGRWMIESNDFQQWFGADQGSVLWCYGIPGAGKSVFTSIAVNHVSDTARGSQSALVYLYIDYKDSTTHSELQLLASICRQLAEQAHPIPVVVRDFVEKNAERKRNPTEDEWVSLIGSLCLLFDGTYILVDALDECPEINRDRFLRSMKKLEKSTRFLFTSRPHIDIPVQFSNFSRLEISASEADIEAYLESEINTNSRLCKFVAKSHNLKESIIERVKSNASGMFLLAHLQMDLLRDQNSVAKVRQAMGTLPADIDETYHSAIRRINQQSLQDQELAKRTLSYIFCAKRPLNVEELLHALGVEVGDAELDEDSFPETDILLGVSAGLIRIDEKSGIILLVHHTLHEYFKKYPDNLLPDPDSEFGHVCLTYLSFDIFESGPCYNDKDLKQRLQEYRLLDYASHNWGHHFKSQMPGQVEKILEFFAQSQKLASSVQILHATQHRTKDSFDRFPRQFGHLHVAAYWGLEKVLSTLLEKFVDVNSKDSYGATPLLIAAMNGNIEATQFLLDSGADINSTNQRQESALYWAARKSYKAILELLLAKGASLTRDHEEWTALNWVILHGDIELANTLFNSNVDLDAGKDGRNEALSLAAEEGQDVLVQMLIDNGADVNAGDWVGSTPLDFATTVGEEAAVRVLLQNGADIDSMDKYHHCALHWAVKHEPIVRLLVEAGANVNVQNDEGQTPLCWSAQEGSVAVTELLLGRNADVNVQDKTGVTPLHRAALKGFDAMIELLLKHGADPNTTDEDDWTPLHCAFVNGHDSSVSLLESKVQNGRAMLESLAAQKQDLNNRAVLAKLAGKKAQGSTALTGLRFAAQEGQVGRMQTMIDKGADVNAKDAGDFTALELAVFQEQKEAALLLLEHGADPNKPGSNEMPPLFYAIDDSNDTMTQLLLDYGANVNTSIDGSTMLHLATYVGNMQIVYSLINMGADIHAKNDFGQTALHSAAARGREDMVRFLIEKGARLDDTDDSERTPLILATENLQHPTVRLLLDHGASVQTRNRDGQTALDIAVNMEDEAMAQLLSPKGGKPPTIDLKGFGLLSLSGSTAA